MITHTNETNTFIIRPYFSSCYWTHSRTHSYMAKLKYSHTVQNSISLASRILQYRQTSQNFW